MDARASDAPPEPPLLITAAGSRRKLPGRFEVELEDRTRVQPSGNLWRDLPLGYHTLRNFDSGEETRLIIAPKRCHLPEELRAWGWTIQLYALRSQSSWGMGDLEDLRRVSTWSADVLGARVIMTNPIGACAPVTPQQPSPYLPSSRLFRNPLYLRIEEIPSARAVLPDFDHLVARGRALNDRATIDRDVIYTLKLQALREIWSRTNDQIDLSRYEQEQGENLDLFAVFCVLAEENGANWRDWPAEYQDPSSPSVAKFAADFQDRVRFHKWIQCLIDVQLARASARGTIVQDLPIGVDAGGFDAWLWQDVFAKRISVGAPPDPFSTKGQDWGLPPFVPHKLRAAAYDPFVQTLRSAMRYSGGLRIDHVMGLFRLFWIPVGASAKQGAYVRYRADELLSILALESVRAKAFVVGEDLGTVEPGVREKLADFRVLSYRVLWFEEKPPKQYPELSLASASTHDLPTIAGVWSGADLHDQANAGLEPNGEGQEKNKKQLQKIADVPESSPVSEVIVKAHEALAQAPSVVILGSLDDALGAEQRPNLPGAMNDKRPNWSIPLPKKLEEVETDHLVARVAHALQESLMNRAFSPKKSAHNKKRTHSW
ncbi:MAG: 4-alpha-glucanotransferase [Acidobacteriaceae bacterium]|nr:4-alpha-glucanotransferase [Acidobacteriaceae bacterium]MBV9297301.1 4-alpha-glucanotransferase [Acidobacteriaceae bacterium]MBV9763780.1 4-alpha-glucanotransferase [Acidobacteriaceae bacterium]